MSSQGHLKAAEFLLTRLPLLTLFGKNNIFNTKVYKVW